MSPHTARSFLDLSLRNPLLCTFQPYGGDKTFKAKHEIDSNSKKLGGCRGQQGWARIKAANYQSQPVPILAQAFPSATMEGPTVRCT